jgi:mono/diheme cytochrome c family protein
MRLRSGAIAAAALILGAAPLAVLAQSGALKPLSSTPNKPWPGRVVTDEPEVPPILSPADALKTFTMAPGYRLELVAAEPLVQDPILAEFDGDGRLWVLEMHGFSINDAMENSFEPINHLVVLEDTNQDGVFDKRNVFLDKLVMPRAFKVLDKNCALVGEPPNLIHACDKNGDLRADTRDILDKTFSRLGVVEHGANGLYWGMDNMLYVAEHTWDLKPTGGKFEIVPSLNRGQWGVTQDNGGRIYRNVNTDPLFVDYVAPRYYVRNPNLVRTSGLYENLVKQENTLIWPIHPTRGVNRGYRTQIFREDGTSTYYGGVSSPMIFRGDRLPKDIQQQPFVVDGPTNIVHLLRLENDAGRLAATDYYKKGEFLASTDIRFRPVSLTPHWDGTFLVIDMYRGISQDGPLQTDYLREYNARRGLAKGINYGRIYRVVHESTAPDRRPQMSRETPAQLVAHLSHPNGWWRDTAQQLLVQRADRSVAPALKRLAASAPADYTRLQALWTLDGLGSLDEGLVVRALDDASPDVRAAALRMSERWLPNSRRLQAAVLKKTTDSNWFVRRQLAATIGELPTGQRLSPALTMLRAYGGDPVVVDAVISGLPGQEAQLLRALVEGQNPSGDAIAMLAGATSKGRDPAQVQALITMASNQAQPQSVRTALLNGLALGLQGGVGNSFGNVVAGGRAGGGIAGVTRRGGGVERLQLAAEPAALTRLSQGSGESAEKAKQVLALLNWPGKPVPPAAAERSPAEERLFVMGRDIYNGSGACAGCHGPEGQGIERVGAKLAGSPFVVGAADVPIRVLVNGKEGSIGLMPPAGQGMNDEELAAVTTYIRGAFGNTAAAVVPAQVKETRAAYAHRTTPWTEKELTVRRP